MPNGLRIEQADRIAHEYFREHWKGPHASKYRPVRLAWLEEHGKVYYQVQWALDRPWGEDDGMFLGSGGFFVSLDTGDVRDVGSAALAYGSMYLHKRDKLQDGVEPDARAVAEILADHSVDDILRLLRDVGDESR